MMGFVDVFRNVMCFPIVALQFHVLGEFRAKTKYYEKYARLLCYQKCLLIRTSSA